MTRSRNHHFVHQAHITLFEDSSQRLTVGGKDGARFYPTARSIFAERDLYAYEVDGFVTSEFEDRLTQIENNTFPALFELAQTRALKASAIPLIRTYMATSFLRNPAQQAGVINSLRHAATAAMRITDQSDLAPRFPNIGTPCDGKTVSQLLEEGLVTVNINNMKFVEAMQRLFDLTAKLISLFELSVVISREGNVAIGDHPLTFMHPTLDGEQYGIPLGGEGCEITFPASKNVCLIGKWKDVLPNSNSAGSLDQVNRRQVLFASKHVATGCELGDVGSMLNRYAKVSFKTEFDVLRLAGGGSLMPARRGLFPTSEWRKVRGDVVALRTVV